MEENKMLLAISDMMDTKLQPIHERLDSLENKLDTGLKNMEVRIKGVEVKLEDLEVKLEDVEVKLEDVEVKLEDLEVKLENKLSTGLRDIHLILENEIKPDIRLLAENYLPAAKRYEESTIDIEDMKEDVELLKKVVAEHSDILQRIS